jgi:hypothetical protein
VRVDQRQDGAVHALAVPDRRVFPHQAERRVQDDGVPVLRSALEQRVDVLHVAGDRVVAALAVLHLIGVNLDAEAVRLAEGGEEGAVAGGEVEDGDVVADDLLRQLARLGGE